MKKKTSAASKVILTLTLLFFYLPILYIIVFSFNDSRSTALTRSSPPWTGSMPISSATVRF